MYRQRPWIPAWVLPIVPILIVAGIALWALRPNTTKVPDLAGATLFAAQQKLDDAGPQARPAAAAGDRAGARPARSSTRFPRPGKTVDKGKEVIVLIAVGSSKVKVPDVVGLTFEAADARLHKAGLQVGQFAPPFDDPAKAIVSHQVPEAGAETAKGSGVDLSINPDTAKTEEPATTAATTDTTGTGTDTTATAPATTGGSPSTTGSGTPTVMPALAGARRGRRHQHAGRRRQDRPGADLQRRRAGRPGRSASDPPEGTKLQPGQKVTITVSQGPAAADRLLAQRPDPHHGLRGQAAGPADRRERRERRGAGLEQRGQPDRLRAAQPRRQHVEHLGRQPGQAADRAPADGDGFIDKRPSFSPNGRVIAFVRASAKTPTDFHLCFKRVSSTGRIPVCIREPAASVVRPSWAPDGNAISVILQTDPKDANQTEVGLFTSATKNSAVPANWNWRGAITDGMHGHGPHEGALYASWAPDGKTLAVSANWGTPFFHLELVPMNSDLPKAGAKPVSVPRVHSCDVSWRPDGLVIVVQQSDTCDGAVSSIMSVVLATRELHPLQSGLTPAWAPALAKP